MAKQKKKQTNTLSPQKKRIFTIIVILTPFVILLLLELGLRLFNYGGNLDLFITGPEDRISHYWMSNGNVSERYFFRQDTKPAPPKDLFLKEKPENGYRIFVMGGSTTAGFPYGNNIMFSRILEMRLKDAFPEKYIEVINTGMSAVNSYTLYDLLDEILDKQPDALFMYAGHNEFYGAMGIGSTETLGKNPKVIHTYLKLAKFKIFLLMRDIVGSIQNMLSRASTGGDMVDPSNTLMARIVSEQTIPYKSETYEKGLAQYERNMRLIFEHASQAGVPIITSELVSNIKDQPPFVSVNMDSFPSADKAYNIGRQLLKQQEFDDARVALTLAKDLDALRFRATEEMNDLIHRIAQDFDAPVVAMNEYFNNMSEQNIIGNELLLEHLHPNVDGYFLMADGFFETMREHQFISDTWNEENIQPASVYRENWGMTELDIANANLAIHYLKGGWPFQPKNAPNRSLANYHPSTRAESLSVRILVDSDYSLALGHYDLGHYYNQKDDFEQAYNEYNALIYSFPSELEFYHLAAENLVMMDENDEAISLLKKSQLYGKTPGTQKWLGIALLRAGNVEEALPLLEQAKEREPDSREVLMSLGAAYQSLGQTDKEQEILSTLRSMGIGGTETPDGIPGNPEAQQRLVYSALLRQGTELMKQGEFNKAYPLLARAHTIHPARITYKFLGLLELNRGAVDKAIELLTEAVRLDPTDFETYYNLTNGYIHVGNKTKAQDLLNEMEQMRPGFNDPQNLRGRLQDMP